ncbi:putative dinucleotide-binding enzyme [Bosea sp. OAE752]
MQRVPLPPIDIGERASTSIVAEWAPGARIVKAFNHHF